MKKIWEKLRRLNRKIGVRLDKKCSSNKNVKVGRCCYGPLADVSGYDSNFIESIGSFCSFGPNTAVVQPHYLGVTTHQFLFASWRYPELDKFMPKDKQKRVFDEYICSKKTVIGNDVWTGRNVTIMAGVKIGNGAIIGAGAVVTKDIPDYAIAVGVPAKIIKYRFTDDIIAKLNHIAWWNWSDELIAERYDDFLDVELFVEKYFCKSKD